MATASPRAAGGLFRAAILSAALACLGGPPAQAECLGLTEAESLSLLDEAVLVFDGEILSVSRPWGLPYRTSVVTARVIDLRKGAPPGDVVRFRVPGSTIRGREVAIEPGYEIAAGDRFRAILVERNGALVQLDVCSRPWPEHLERLPGGPPLKALYGNGSRSDANSTQER